MSNTEKPINRSTGSIIAKCAVIFVVLGVVCFLSIWAWFTHSTKATADGINVIAKAEGVEVSWDGVDYFYDLTAKDESEYKSNVTGYAKNLCDSEGNPAPLKLVTGNGINFFEPYVNRRTGTPLVKNGVWQGVDIVDGVNSEGKYIDLDLYFRGINESNIYLSGESRVTPKNEDKYGLHKSAYGPFSKDNIASAARLAFLGVEDTKDEDGNVVDSSITDCKFIWAPNANLRLHGNSDGYERYQKIDETEGFEAGDLGEVIDFTTQKGDYYLWLPTKYESDEKTQEAHLASNKMKFTVYDEKNGTGLYTYDYVITEPNAGKNATLLYYINESGTEWNSDDISYVEVSKSKANNDTSDSSPKVALADTFTLNDIYSNNGQAIQVNRKAPAFYIEGSQFKAQDITITIGYNPEDKEVVIVGYHCEGIKTYNRAGKAIESQKYYELPSTTTNVALVNPQTAIAISGDQNNNHKKGVAFSDSPTNNNVTSLSVTLSEQFTATKKGEGIDAKYTFKNKESNTWLAIKNGNFTWDANEFEFSLYYHKDFNGPLIKSGDYVLAVRDNEVVAADINNLNVDYAITVFIGSEYTFNYGSEEIYEYYNNTIPEGSEKPIGKVSLNTVSTPPLHTTKSVIKDNPIDIENPLEVGPCIAVLNAENNYSAHIKVRLWVEGTDDDAQTPLADGIFDIALHFTTKFINTQ